jgi:dTDP-4-dehydrorhamnose 3,5-epimerase
VSQSASPIEGLILVQPRVFQDDRGFFFESYHQPRYQAQGIDVTFVQDNHSFSRQGTLRGLHFQTSPGQAKLVRCVRGRIWDVAVDLRPDSVTFGQWQAFELDSQSHHQLFIPVGFAHGFCVLSEEAEVLYKCSSIYDGTTESGLAWDDPELAVAWPVTNPVISVRDQGNESFAAYKSRLKGA